MAKKIGGRRVTRGQKVGQSNLQGVLSGALDFVPGIGDAKAFYEAETPLEYGLAGVGLIPGVGDAAAGALKAVTPLFKNPLAKDFKLTPHQAKNAQRDFGVSPDSEEYKRVVADAQRQFAEPSLAIENVDQVPIRGGEVPLTYAPYKLPDGRTVHATYTQDGKLLNVLGGKRSKPSETKDFAPNLGPLQQQKRPGKDFVVNTETSQSSSKDAYYDTIGDIFKKQKGPLQSGGISAKKLRYKEKLEAKLNAGEELTDKELTELIALGG